jgi:molybdopterin-guanine dinucleotide biosynthesis protein A
MLPGEPNIIGVVLCGGKSSRMGSDKGLMITQETYWAKEAAAKLKFLHSDIYFSVNEMQVEPYAAIVERNYLITDNEALNTGGPLKGLLSVHECFPEQGILLLACDMPLMKTEVVEFLWQQCQQIEYDAYVFGEPGYSEPLAAIYRAKALAFIHEQLQSGQLQRFSMQHVLQLLHTKYYPIPAQWKDAFLNVNSVEGLKRIVR